MEDEKVKSLKAILELKDAKVTFEGNYDEVWRSIEEYLQRPNPSFDGGVAKGFKSGKKSVAGMILELKDEGFFNQGRTPHETYLRIRERGRTNITSNAVSMALKRLVEISRMKRQSKGAGYVYFS